MKTFMQRVWQSLQGLCSNSARETAGVPGTLRPVGEFVDCRGHRYQRREGFRETVKPNWRSFFQERQPVAKPEKIAAARQTIIATEQLLQIFNLTFQDASVLEIGCHGGAHSFAIAEHGARSVYATDVVEYWEREVRPLEGSASLERTQSDFLRQLQSDTARHFSTSQNVEFGLLDVTRLDHVEQYDAIVSWETLEHVPDVGGSLQKMYAALKPGGFCFHEYNPFFCLGGGHSLCTLDFPFGHVVLNEDDFSRYLSEFRPEEKGLALDFYRKSLNRMTLQDLRGHIEAAGFETLSFIEWPGRGKLQWISDEILLAAQELYPSATIQDLLSDQVWVLLRKPF